ncbi:inositol polyphosphate kinase-domain-containing protein [Massariosphaeria phaeospora]|uniref:Kinase n=1 Tax=Massariosphaeria phaeospora TaxID=100035 RepID=A0A7C8MAR2_9PLEO|nr:inositol polyphosphate kinase-domain-containing protein [Massariosphaeria phaeospora]
MPKKPFDPSSLQVFGNAAAGHDGVLSDDTGAVVVKPCTQAEITFYESVAADHPDLVPHLPTFMGQLSLSGDKSATEASESDFIQTATGALERLHGKKLETELHIVLENITHGFKRPNVLDLKLGAQLWDEHSKPEKRARLDEVSAATTSGSLGFRIAGMRTWKGDGAPEVEGDLKQYIEKIDADGYCVYNKMYGRKFSAQDVIEGFEAYVLPQTKSLAELERAREILAFFLGEVKDIQEVFEKKESRMYGASILLVYEGDIDEYAKTKKILRSAEPAEDEDEDLPQLAVVKMIDFAHTTWQPGQGPDENAIRGMRSSAKILKDLLDKTERDLADAEDA